MAKAKSKPKKAKIAVVVCTDKNLFWQSAFFLARAISLDPDKLVDFYLYCSDPFDPKLKKALGPRVKIVFTEKAGFADDIPLSSHISKATFLRMIALEELCPHYEQVAYSDIDVFQRWGSFGELINLAGHEQPLAAVRDRSLWGREPEVWVAKNYFPNLPSGVHNRYFNAGIIVANSKVFLAQEITQRALAFLRDYPELCHYADQSALNAAVNGDWLELSPSWNWQANTRYDHLIPLRNPRFVHFTGPIKPWKDKRRRFDEVYFFAMKQWLEISGLQHILADIPEATFFASRERLRTRLLAEQHTSPLEMREFVKPYIDRTDFADAELGLPVFGWTDDR